MGSPWAPHVASHICDPAPVPGHCLGLQCRLFHPLTKGLELILGVQDEEAWVLGGTLEEGYVWVQPPGKRGQERVRYSGCRRSAFCRHPPARCPGAPKAIFLN